MDYRKYYHLEDYLLSEVSDRFRETCELSAFDFHCILIWKANRAKKRHLQRLRRLGGQTYAECIMRLVTELTECRTPKERLGLLMHNWRFRLPTASAILTVLYPNEFTVYDTRVCEQLHDFHKLASRQFTDSLWENYCEFKAAVKRSAPARLCLRDKDRYLWGKSFVEQVQHDVA